MYMKDDCVDTKYFYIKYAKTPYGAKLALKRAINAGKLGKNLYNSFTIIDKSNAFRMSLSKDK